MSLVVSVYRLGLCDRRLRRIRTSAQAIGFGGSRLLSRSEAHLPEQLVLGLGLALGLRNPIIVRRRKFSLGNSSVVGNSQDEDGIHSDRLSK